MAQEEVLSQKVTALGRRVKELERLLKLGLVGDDLRPTVEQHSALLGRLVGDSILGNTLLGPFPGVDSSMSLKRPGSNLYRGGGLNVVSTLGSVGLGPDLLNALPFYMPGQPNLISQITINVLVSASAATNARLGIYDNVSGNVYPRRKKFEGTLSWTTAGNKSLTGLRVSLPRGLYWLTLVHDRAAIDPNSFSGYSATPGAWVPIGESAPVPSGGNVGWQAAFTFGALPDIYPDGGVELTLAACIWIGFTT